MKTYFGRKQNTNVYNKWIKYSDIQLLHNEGDAKNFQSSEQKLSIDISHPHFPLETLWNFIEFWFNKIPEKYSGTELNIHSWNFLQKYLAALTVNQFHKILHHRRLTGSLTRLSENKLKCCSEKVKASYSFHSIYYSSFLLHSQRYFKF